MNALYTYYLTKSAGTAGNVLKSGLKIIPRGSSRNIVKIKKPSGPSINPPPTTPATNVVKNRNSFMNDVRAIGRTLDSVPNSGKVDFTAFKPTARPDIVSRGISKAVKTIPGDFSTSVGNSIGGFTKSPVGRMTQRGLLASALGYGGKEVYNIPDYAAQHIQDTLAENNLELSDARRNQLAGRYRRNAFPILGQMINPYVNPSFWKPRSELTTGQIHAKDQAALAWRLGTNTMVDQLLGRDKDLSAWETTKNLSKGLPAAATRELTRLGFNYKNQDIHDRLDSSSLTTDSSSRAFHNYLADFQTSGPDRFRHALSTPLGNATSNTARFLLKNTKYNSQL